ncbi:nitrogenase component 1 [Sporomusa termitida]|uniref:Nitrogenase component 1 type Oxidoreductase n=1 Tax=Sporomusa termitida TaxID=2377 RepID=A0A517DUL0_9FIRM|nr:nitrogenase component 1 [Sporomusa termitida]QDR81041.1 Nitrogenase component 1 type Oxidoreductase [Sporomusa termitida]
MAINLKVTEAKVRETRLSAIIAYKGSVKDSAFQAESHFCDNVLRVRHYWRGCQWNFKRMEKEIPVPLVPVHCEGLCSKLWASGFDAAFHALLAYIVKPAQQKRPDLVNIINFAGVGRAQVIRLLNRLGLEPQFIVQFATLEQVERLSRFRWANGQ